MPDNQLFTALGDALSSAGWQYQRVPGRDVLELAFEAHHGRVHILAQVFPPIGAIGITSEAHTALSPAHRLKAAELLMRTNLELTVGNFEMDWDSLRVFFRTTNLFGDAPPQPGLVVGMVHAAVAEMDRMIAMCGVLASYPESAMARLDLGPLMRREDLLPPVGGDTAAPLRPLFG